MDLMTERIGNIEVTGLDVLKPETQNEVIQVLMPISFAKLRVMFVEDDGILAPSGYFCHGNLSILVNTVTLFGTAKTSEHILSTLAHEVAHAKFFLNNSSLFEKLHERYRNGMFGDYKEYLLQYIEKTAWKAQLRYERLICEHTFSTLSCVDDVAREHIKNIFLEK